MEREAGAHPFQTPNRRDTEAYCERKTWPNMASRLVAKLRGNAQMQIRGPMDEAVGMGARLYSIDSATFLAIFSATKSELMVCPDKAFEIIVRSPDKDCVLACIDIYFTIACIAPADLMRSGRRYVSASREATY